MRVHHIVNDVCLQNGGAQRVVRQLHIGLREAGLDSQVVSLCHSVKGLESALSLQNRSPYVHSAFESVLRYIRTECTTEDIIHVHLFPSLLYVAVAVRLLGWKGKLVCTEHSTSNGRRNSWIGKLMDSLIYPRYDRIYCISDGVQTALEKWMPRQSDKLRTVVNGVSLPFQNFRGRAAGEKIAIASAGRLSKPKNYETALKALALLEDVDFEYRIAGIGEAESELKQLCARLNLENKVKFCGYVEDIFCFLESADIFLIPSLWEGFGLAAVEAMNAGLSVVASDVSGMREIFDTVEPCGITVSPNSPDEIASAVRACLDAETRAEFGQRAFVRSLSFSKERMVESYLNEYARLAK